MTEQVLPQIALTGSAAGLDPAKALEHALVTYQEEVRTSLLHRLLSAGEMTGDVLSAALMEVAAGHLGAFRIMAGVAFRLAAKNARARQHLPAADLTEAAHLADAEALNLGAYLAAQDANAVMASYHLQVNAKVPEAAAARRAVERFGLTLSQARTSFKIKDDPVESARAGGYESKTKAFIQRARAQRIKTLIADAIAKAEGQAEQAGREDARARGELSLDVQKMWLTAADERTCPTCAPMDGVTVDLDATFLLPDGNRVKHPPVHPNCRCKAETVSEHEDGAVSKAWEEKEHPRGTHGRFRTKVKEGPAMDTDLWRMLADRMEPDRMQVQDAFGVQQMQTPTMQAQGMQVNRMEAAPQMAAAGMLRPAEVQSSQAMRRMNMEHQVKVAMNVAANERLQPQRTEPDVQPMAPQMVGFAADRDLNIQRYATDSEAGYAQIDVPVHFVDGNDRLAVAAALNKAMHGLDRHLREYQPRSEFIDLEQAHDPGLARAARDLRVAMDAASRKPKGEVQVEISPEEASEAWRHVLSPTGSGYKSHFLMEAVDEEGNVVASTMVPSETAVAFTNLGSNFEWMPHAIVAPHGTWKKDSPYGTTTSLTPGSMEKLVTGAFQFKRSHGVLVLTPDSGVYRRANPEN